MRYWMVIVGFLTLLQSCGEDGGKKEKVKIPEVTKQPVVESSGSVDGATLFNTCKVCHGEKGEGNKTLNAPTLVNMNPWYIERQLNNFRHGIRGVDTRDEHGAQMATIAKTLTSDESVKAVVEYIKTLPAVQPEKTLSGNVADGKSSYNMICGACHGPNGAGNKMLHAPRLHGTNDWYLYRQFNNFKNGIRGAHKDDEYGAQMKNISATITTDEDLVNIITFIQSVNK